MTLLAEAVIFESMTGKARSLLEEAKKLTEDERETLAYQILRSIGERDEALSPEWREEIDRRIERAASGAAGPGLPWRKAMSEIRRRLKKPRGKKR